MANRHLLHLSKIDEFAAWAGCHGYRRESCKGEFEVLRLRIIQPAPSPLLVYYERITGDHATFPDEGPAGALVRRWIRERKER